MRKNILLFVATFSIAVTVSACGESDFAIESSVHREEVLEWRAGRLERLLAPSGFLTLSGLFWLPPGKYAFGADNDNDVVFPAGAAPTIGRFSVSDAGISMDIADGVDVFSDEFPVSSMHIADDNTESPDTITHRNMAWTVIRRQNRYAVRLRDFDNPALTAFGKLPYFDIDPALRVIATMHRYEKPRIVPVSTVIEGLGWDPESPGTVAFEIDDVSYNIEAYASGDSLFYVFGDVTNRNDTYGAGRFLYSDLPDDSGRLVLDFNRAYSPPCAFNDFSTCPVASPRNRLSVRIEAGEKYDPALYFGSQH